MEKQNKFKKIDITKIKNKLSGNNLFIVLIVAMIVSYMFFFSSTYIFKPSEESLSYTDVREKQGIGNKVFTISQWLYSPEQEKMQVSLLFDNTESSNDAEIAEYTFSSMTRSVSKSISNNTCEVVYSSNSIKIVDINNVPEDFAEVSLNIDKKDKTLEMNIDDNEDSDNSVVDSTSIYTNMYKVKTVEKISKKSAIEYEIDRLENNQRTYQGNIKDAKSKIKMLNKDNDKMNEEITKLELEKRYSTTTEYTVINEQQNSYRSSIKSNMDSIKDLEVTISENEKLVEEIKIKILELERSK